MSGFVEALDAYRRGTLSRDELLAQIEQQLAQGAADSGTLIAALNNEQARERLPGNIHIEIVRQLLRRRDSPLDLKALRAPKIVALQLQDDDAATVLVDHTGSRARPSSPPPRRKSFISVGTV